MQIRDNVFNVGTVDILGSSGNYTNNFANAIEVRGNYFNHFANAIQDPGQGWTIAANTVEMVHRTRDLSTLNRKLALLRSMARA